MNQPSLDYESKKRKTRREKFERMDGLIPWKSWKSAFDRSTQGWPRSASLRAAMLRIHCVQLFYNLSDPGMQDML